MKEAKIYFLRNKLNNEIFYVGSTVTTLKARLSGHFAPSNSLKTKEYIEKYGKENIEIVEIEKVDIKFRYEREIYWTLFYKEKYNLVNIALGHGHKTSQETKEKIRRHHILNGVCKGEKNPRYGKVLTKETRERISKALKGKYKGDNACHTTSIYCSETNKYYKTIVSASKELNIPYSSIRSAIHSHTHYAHGYHFYKRGDLNG